MSFITFIYRIRKNPKTYYGKCFFDYISDNHEGLDNEVKYFLKQGLNAHRKKKQNSKNKVKNYDWDIIIIIKRNHPNIFYK